MMTPQKFLSFLQGKVKTPLNTCRIFICSDNYIKQYLPCRMQIRQVRSSPMSLPCACWRGTEN